MISVYIELSGDAPPTGFQGQALPSPYCPIGGAPPSLAETSGETATPTHQTPWKQVETLLFFRLICY